MSVSQPALYDAHNHLQDPRLAPFRQTIWKDLENQNVRCMVVNGSCEEDWPQVLALAREDSRILPSFGYHPGCVQERTGNWRETLTHFAGQVASGIGEIGLDRWIPDFDFDAQQEVFIWQLRFAAERNLPVSIHCLQAWGRLLEILKSEPQPRCGFLLHSYGGPAEMVEELAALGAYFSMSGYFAHERKSRQRETVRNIPIDRLLIETDAPDQLLPASRSKFSLISRDQKPLNHPANLAEIYVSAAEIRGLSLPDLASVIEQNFARLFGKSMPRG